MFDGTSPCLMQGWKKDMDSVTAGNCTVGFRFKGPSAITFNWALKSLRFQLQGDFLAENILK